VCVCAAWPGLPRQPYRSPAGAGSAQPPGVPLAGQRCAGCASTGPTVFRRRRAV